MQSMVLDRWCSVARCRDQLPGVMAGLSPCLNGMAAWLDPRTATAPRLLPNADRDFGHNFFVAPHPQMATAWVADETGARKVLGHIASAVEGPE